MSWKTGRRGKMRHECGECRKVVKDGKDGEDGVMCDYCQLWFHLRCGNVDAPLFGALSNFEEKENGTGLHWYCRECCRAVEGMMAERREMKKGGGRGRAEVDVEGLRKDVEGLRKDVGEIVDGAVGKMLKAWEAGSLRKDVEGIVEGAVGRMLKAFAMVQVRQDALEGELNGVRTELVEVRAGVEIVGEQVKIMEERENGLNWVKIGGFGDRMDAGESCLSEKVGVEKDMSVDKEDFMQMLDGNRLTVHWGDRGELGGTAYMEVSPSTKDMVAPPSYVEVISRERRVEYEVGQGEEKRWLVQSREEMDMSVKGRNLVIMGIEEQGEEEVRSGILGKIGQILEEVGQGRRCQFRYIGRIGKKQVGRSRPVRIEMEDMNLRRRVLSKAKTLKESTSFNRVFIVPDLTRSQQLVDTKLRDKVKELKKRGVKDARIERGEIVRGSGVDKKVVHMQD
jgi:hypothetical protein